MNRARRRLTSVIEQISMSERRIPYEVIIRRIKSLYVVYVIVTVVLFEFV